VLCDGIVGGTGGGPPTGSGVGGFGGAENCPDDISLGAFTSDCCAGPSSGDRCSGGGDGGPLGGGAGGPLGGAGGRDKITVGASGAEEGGGDGGPAERGCIVGGSCGGSGGGAEGTSSGRYAGGPASAPPSLILVPRFTRCCLMSPTTSWTSKSSGFARAISSSRKKIGFRSSSSVTRSTCWSRLFNSSRGFRLSAPTMFILHYEPRRHEAVHQAGSLGAPESLTRAAHGSRHLKQL
jgi:hypothetical protein